MILISDYQGWSTPAGQQGGRRELLGSPQQLLQRRRQVRAFCIYQLYLIKLYFFKLFFSTVLFQVVFDQLVFLQVVLFQVIFLQVVFLQVVSSGSTMCLATTGSQLSVRLSCSHRDFQAYFAVTETLNLLIIYSN